MSILSRVKDLLKRDKAARGLFSASTAIVLLIWSVHSHGADVNVHVIAPDSQYTPWLGLTIQEIDEYNAVKYGLPAGTSGGLVVLDVIRGGPADEAGISRGDVILSLDGREIKGYEDFSNWIEEFDMGSTIRLLVSRSGAVNDVILTLGSFPGEFRGGYGFMDPWLKDYLAETGEYEGCYWLRESREFDAIFYRAFASLDLTDAQKRAARGVMSGFEREMVRLSAEIRVGEIDLRELLSSPEADLKKVRAKINEVSGRGAEAEYLRVRTRHELKKILTYVQSEKLERDLAFIGGRGWLWRGHGASPSPPLAPLPPLPPLPPMPPHPLHE